MNKGFKEFFQGYGMTINGNNAYGQIKGYETNVTIRMMDKISPVVIHVSCYTTSEQKRAIERSLQSATIKYFRFSFSEFGIKLGFNDITAGRLIKRLPDLLNQIYGILSVQGALSAKYCPFCGNELTLESSKKADVEGFTITLSSDCIANLNKTIAEENKDFTEAPNNYVEGFFGALLGGIIGGIIAFILYMVGFVSAISAFVAALLGAYFYKKFHGKPNAVMIVIVAVTTLACMAASVVVIYTAAAAIGAEDAGVVMGAIEAFRFCMQDAEFSGMFYSDLAMSMMFSVLGIGYQIFVLAKSIKRKKAIQ